MTMDLVPMRAYPSRCFFKAGMSTAWPSVLSNRVRVCTAQGTVVVSDVVRSILRLLQNPAYRLKGGMA
ncbi:hypothetical protein EC915_11948 [Pseudomonas sp. LP_7_YM]|nr:hypothetical protein EC915_11948 [Pseudomonas sp. LP_7_YM]